MKNNSRKQASPRKFPKKKVRPKHPEDDVIDNDLILVWGKQKRIITGSDLLGRLLPGISIKPALVTHRVNDLRVDEKTNSTKALEIAALAIACIKEPGYAQNQSQGR